MKKIKELFDAIELSVVRIIDSLTRNLKAYGEYKDSYVNGYAAINNLRYRHDYSIVSLDSLYQDLKQHVSPGFKRGMEDALNNICKKLINCACGE